MLGVYDSFPENVQAIGVFSLSIQRIRLQRAIVRSFHELNDQTLALEDFSGPSIPHCETRLELGIADGKTFSLLDEEETEAVLDALEKKPLASMDFLCAIRYHKVHDGKAKPLRFDYYMLRFLFSKNLVELLIFHERGSMHVLPEELATFLSHKINGLFHRNALKAIEAP